MAEIISLAIDKIRENPVALRAVNRESEQYIGLVASIKEKGFIGAISARKQIDSNTNEEYFELIDGLHRWMAARDAGLSEIPVVVMALDKMGVMEAQVMMNVHKIDTRPIEFTHQLQRMIIMNPTMTISELASKLGKSTTWITARLGLLKLEENIQKLVDDGKITLSNAFALAKLEKEEQVNFVEQAMTQSPAEFAPAVNARVKEIKDARKAGRESTEPGFQPTAFLQKKSEIETELKSLSTLKQLIAEANITDPVEAASLAIAWVLNLDPKSVAKQQADFEARKAKQKEAAEKRKLERANKKAEEAKKEAEELAAKQA